MKEIMKIIAYYMLFITLLIGPSFATQMTDPFDAQNVVRAATIKFLDENPKAFNEYVQGVSTIQVKFSEPKTNLAQEDSSLVFEDGKWSWYLGNHSWRDSGRPCVRHGEWEMLRHSKDVYADFWHPKVEDMINDIKGCSILAGTTAVVVAVATESPATGKQLFYPVWLQCMISKMGDRAKEIDVRLRAKGRSDDGDWENH